MVIGETFPSKQNEYTLKAVTDTCVGYFIHPHF